MAEAKTKPPLRAVYAALFKRWGRQHWWPGQSRFEMMIGAILTQNTAWTNVEKAIRQLKRARVLTPEAMNNLPEVKLAELIRPSGSFNIKARRVKNFVRWIHEHHGGNVTRMFRGSTEKLRNDLLSVNGIGNETADSMLLYAGKKPVFVVDAYTRRFLQRHGWIKPDATYDEIAAMFELAFRTMPAPEKVQCFNEYHALIVALAKRHCRSKPNCAACPLRRWLPKSARPRLRLAGSVGDLALPTVEQSSSS